MKYCFLLWGVFLILSCQQQDKNQVAQRYYTQQDTVNVYGHKFLKKEFNIIVDSFPELYQETVLHPDSIWKFYDPWDRKVIDATGQKQNISFNSEVGKDQYYVLYAYFWAMKNKGTRFEYDRKHLTTCYEMVNEIFERLSRGGTEYIHQSSRLSAYVEYDIYFINHSPRVPVFTKQTRFERFLFIDDLKKKIEPESRMADISYEFEDEKIVNLVHKLDASIVNDFILEKAKEITKPHLEAFDEGQKTTE